MSGAGMRDRARLFSSKDPQIKTGVRCITRPVLQRSYAGQGSQKLRKGITAENRLALTDAHTLAEQSRYLNDEDSLNGAGHTNRSKNGSSLLNN